MASTTFSTLAPSGGTNPATDDAVTYIREELLDLAEKLTVFAQFAEQVSLPQHNSKTIQFSRYPYLQLPQTPASEGVTGSDQALSVQTVTATTDQWILTVTLTDLAQLTIKHPLVPVVNDLLGYAMAQLVDREIYNVLVSGATVVFPGSVASRATLSSSNILDDATIMKTAATLRSLGARSMDGMNYILIVDPFSEADVMAQTSTFLAAHQFKNVEALYNSEIGRWRGYRVVRSNLMPVIALLSGGSAAASGADGSWGGTVDVYWKITAKDNQYGFESQIGAASDTGTTAVTINQHIVVTVPSTAGYTYNVYVSDTDATSTDANLHLFQSGIAPSGVSDSILGFQATGVNPPPTPPSGVNVHTAFALGRQSNAMVKLSGDNMRVLVTPQTPSDSDPAAQRRKLSFIGSFKSVILNSDFLRKIETASAFG